MTAFTGIAEAALAIQDFMLDRPAALPDHARDQIRGLLGQTKSPVDAVVKAAEIIYANRQDMPPEALELGAALANVAELHGFHGMDENHRGSRMALVMRGGDVEAAPEVKAEFAPAVQAEEPAPVPAQPAPAPAQPAA